MEQTNPFCRLHVRLKFFINEHCRYAAGRNILIFPLRGGIIFFIINILPLPGWALLSFVLRKRVTRESNSRGDFAMLNSPLENPLSFFGARTLRTAPRVRILIMFSAALCAQVRVPH